VVGFVGRRWVRSAAGSRMRWILVSHRRRSNPLVAAGNGVFFWLLVLVDYAGNGWQLFLLAAGSSRWRLVLVGSGRLDWRQAAVLDYVGGRRR